MFGLRTPISKSEEKDEFDSVATILSHSCVARSLNQQHTPSWMRSAGADGDIFHLELSPDVQAKLVYMNNGDCGSISSLTLGLGCNSEDTGYSSDQDLGITDHHFLNKSKLNGVNKTLAKRVDRYKNDSKINSRIPRSPDRLFVQTSPFSVRDFHEKNFATPTSKPESSDTSCIYKSHNTNIFTFLDHDDGVCLRKSDLRSSKDSNISLKSHKSGLSVNSVESSSYGDNKTLCKNNSRGGSTNKHTNSPATSFASKQCFEYKSVIIETRLLNSFRNDSCENTDVKIPGLSLCERLLGIVPAGRDNCETAFKHINSEIIVKRVLPGSPASLKPAISVGSILHSVNGHEITLNNMSALLSSLSNLKKLKVTMKSQRTETSRVDLETLVNILTSDAIDHHALDKMAAMYISLEGVNPDSLDSTNDGMVYSFPNEQNPLHQLLGLFYTLSHVVKDINKSNTIKNTTLILDGQKIHVAYWQEGNDILVFAMPVTCASVSQLNALLLRFTRLLRVLFNSIESVFRNGLHTIFIDSILTYLFRQILTTPVISSLLSSSLSSAPDSKNGIFQSECFPFLKYSNNVQAVSLPDELMITVEKTLSKFESSNFADMSEHFYGCRRQYTILGSAFFYCGQLVCSHLAPEDLHDLHLYLGHLGILELTTRSSVAQFLAWKEIFPTRFCHDIAGINNIFGYSEPTAKWCWLIVALKHGLFCCLLETIGPTLLQNTLYPDVFYVDQARACLMQLQTPELLAVLNVRINKDSQPPVKSDYCATYVNTTGEKVAHIFGDECKTRNNHRTSLMLSLQSHVSRNSIGSDISFNSREVENLYQSPHDGKMYPVANNGNTYMTTSSTVALSKVPVLHKLSTSRYPSIYQYCCLDGLEGTIIVGSDITNPGLFHAQIVHNFYQCCRQIHSYFGTSENKQARKSHKKDKDNDQKENPILPEQPIKGVKEHGILMTFNPNQGEKVHKSKWSLEYWVVGESKWVNYHSFSYPQEECLFWERQIEHPSMKELYVCFHPSTPQNVIELAFRLNFGSYS